MSKNILPIYQATKLKIIAIRGGTTKPCIVTAKTDAGEVDYVVKIFKQSYLEKGHPVHSEVFANILAKEFDLNVPKSALIDIPHWLISELRSDVAYKDYNPNDIIAGLHFATEYIDGKDYTLALSNKYLDDYDIATIFAFDTLILHTDRRVGKPNLFFKNEDIYLIDHETALVIGKQTYTSILENQRYQYITNKNTNGKQGHLFLDYLRQLPPKKKKHIFDTFFEYLNLLDTNVLDAYAEQISETQQQRFSTHEGDMDNNIFDYLRIKQYLCAVKLNAPHFISLLKQLITV